MKNGDNKIIIIFKDFTALWNEYFRILNKTNPAFIPLINVDEVRNTFSILFSSSTHITWVTAQVDCVVISIRYVALDM